MCGVCKFLWLLVCGVLEKLSLLWQTFVAKHQNQNLEFCESVDFFWSEFGHFVFVLGLIHGHQA